METKSPEWWFDDVGRIRTAGELQEHPAVFVATALEHNARVMMSRGGIIPATRRPHWAEPEHGPEEYLIPLVARTPEERIAWLEKAIAHYGTEPAPEAGTPLHAALERITAEYEAHLGTRRPDESLALDEPDTLTDPAGITLPRTDPDGKLGR